MAIKERSKPPLTRLRRIKLSFLSGFLFIIILGAVLYSAQAKKTLPIPTPSLQAVSHQFKQEPAARESISYKGKSGMDALTLLREHASVVLDHSGMVSSINGRKNDTAKKEFWSFFINGKMAEVGSAAYITKDSDLLEWKMQTY